MSCIRCISANPKNIGQKHSLYGVPDVHQVHFVHRYADCGTSKTPTKRISRNLEAIRGGPKRTISALKPTLLACFKAPLVQQVDQRDRGVSNRLRSWHYEPAPVLLAGLFLAALANAWAQLAALHCALTDFTQLFEQPLCPCLAGCLTTPIKVTDAS